MGSFTFTLKNGNSHTINTTLESENGFFVDPYNNNSAQLDAFSLYRQEKEDEALLNQPPELFKFFKLEFFDEDGRSYQEWVGEKSEETAIKTLRKVNNLNKNEVVKLIESYSKFCNFMALTDEEAAASCYGVFV